MTNQCYASVMSYQKLYTRFEVCDSGIAVTIDTPASGHWMLLLYTESDTSKAIKASSRKRFGKARGKRDGIASGTKQPLWSLVKK